MEAHVGNGSPVRQGLNAETEDFDEKIAITNSMNIEPI
mgnify:CR=1 FL=1